MARGPPSPFVVLVVLLAFLSNLMIFVKPIEGARILHTSCSSDDANHCPRPQQGPDSSCSRSGEQDPQPGRTEMEIPVDCAAAPTVMNSKVKVNRQVFQMLPRGTDVPPTGIPSPIHN